MFTATVKLATASVRGSWIHRNYVFALIAMPRNMHGAGKHNFIELKKTHHRAWVMQAGLWRFYSKTMLPFVLEILAYGLSGVGEVVACFVNEDATIRFWNIQQTTLCDTTKFEAKF
mgnify:CR=1 FL=1